MARLKAPLPWSMCRRCQQSYITQLRRALSDTPSSRESTYPPSRLSQRRIKVNDEPSTKESANPLFPFSEIMKGTNTTPGTNTNNSMRSVFRDTKTVQDETTTTDPTTRNPYADEPYHINVYAHRHNTHITFTEPSRNPILSFSCGNIGLRNAQKASYDASFQLCAYTFRKIAEKQWKLGGSKGNKSNNSPWCTLSSIKKPAYSHSAGDGIEVILRGFGPGREAFQKALLGTEGRMLKPLISKVTDGTRLKFGGTRSPQVRRLG